MGRVGLIVLCCFALGGCAVPLGMVAAGMAGGAATEASSHVGRDAGQRIALWLRGDTPPADCEVNPAAEGCEAEALLTEYLKRATPEQREQLLAALSPEQRERVLEALPPDLREQMEAAAEAELPAPAAGVRREPRRAPPPHPIGPLRLPDAGAL